MDNREHYSLTTMKQESYLMRKLQIEHPAGISDLAERSRIVREAILGKGVADTEVGRNNQKRVISFRQLYEMVYEQKLQPQESLF